MGPTAAAWRRLAPMILATSCLLGGASEKRVQAASPPPAPACQAPEDEGARVSAAEVIESLRRRAVERPPGEGVVKALDNRGYGYAPAPDPFAVPPVQEPRPAR